MNYLSCFDFLFQRELKGATVYSIFNRKSEFEGRWYGPLTRQRTSVRPCLSRHDPSLCKSTPRASYNFLNSSFFLPSDLNYAKLLKSQLIIDYKNNITMSIYSGFATRRDESKYNDLLSKLITMLQNHLLQTIKSVTQDNLNKKIVNYAKIINKMRQY